MVQIAYYVKLLALNAMLPLQIVQDAPKHLINIYIIIFVMMLVKMVIGKISQMLPINYALLATVNINL